MPGEAQQNKTGNLGPTALAGGGKQLTINIEDDKR